MWLQASDAQNAIYISPQAYVALAGIGGIIVTIVTVMWKYIKDIQDQRVADLKLVVAQRDEYIKQLRDDAAKEEERLNKDNYELRGALLKAVATSARAIDAAKLGIEVAQKSE